MALSTMPKKTKTETDRRVAVYWLPEEISQSYEQESKACTLISVLAVLKCHEANVKFTPDISQKLVNIYFSSIKEGNHVYNKLEEDKKLNAKYINIPEALKAVSMYQSNNEPSHVVVEWNSFWYDTDMQSTLYSNIKDGICLWEKEKPKEAKSSNLAIVILANVRAVVLIHSVTQPGLVTLLDSHGHDPYGAVIAIAPQTYLSELCTWYARTLIKSTDDAVCYELSFLYCI